MAGFIIHDWDSAYENGGNIVGSEQLKVDWPVEAEKFRQQSNAQLDIGVGNTRARYDIFAPSVASKGMFVFIHGGYWQTTHKGFWSHLAQGAVDAGWTAVLPGYDLCPEVGIADIIEMVGMSIEDAAGRIDGPIVLTGHSAGGHLVAEMCDETSPLSQATRERIRHLVPISGVFDLRPLINTKLNNALQLDWASASALSPVLKKPMAGIKLSAWVGAGERTEFLRQNRMFADMWRGLGLWTQTVEEPDRHHFSVVNGLRDANSPLMQCALNLSQL